MNLNAQVLLGDEEIDIAPFIISLNRDWSLCNSTQTVGIVADLALRYYLEFFSMTIKPSLKLNIWEFGVKVFTGHVNTVKFQRKPDEFIEINATDNFKFVKDYFIDETLGTTNGETVAYWIGRILAACGLSYNINSGEAYTLTVAPEIELNLISADEALTQVLAYAFSYAYAGPGGRINIDSGARPSNIKFKSGITTLYDDNDPTNIDGGNVVRASHQMNDANTRDIVKVWGWKRWNLAPNESPYIQVTNTAGLGLPVPKTILYSSSMIGDYDTALDLSERILTEVGKYDSVLTLECLGNPNIRIGQRVEIDVDLESEHIVGTAKITSIHSSMSADGYMMQVKTDEFCPKFAAWSITNPYLYAGTDGNGVYLSRDKGVTWAEYNNGLPSGIKVASRVGADPYGNAVAIVNSGVWCEANNLWAQQTIPLGIPKAVGALGGYNDFAVLTAGGGSRVYFSRSTAAVSGEMLGSTISGWEPMQMYLDDFMTLGRSYAVTAYDMYTKTGSAYVIATASIGSGTYNAGTDCIASGNGYPIEYTGGRIDINYTGAHVYSGTGEFWDCLDSTDGDPYTYGQVSLEQDSSIGMAIKFTTSENQHSSGTLSRIRIKGRFQGDGFSRSGSDKASLYFTTSDETTDWYDFWGTLITATPSNLNDTSTTIEVNPYSQTNFDLTLPVGLTNHWYNTGYIEARVTFPSYPSDTNAHVATVYIDKVTVEYSLTTSYDDISQYPGVFTTFECLGNPHPQILLIGPTFAVPYGEEDTGAPGNNFFDLCVDYGYIDPEHGWDWRHDSVPISEVYGAYGYPRVTTTFASEYTGPYTGSDMLHLDSSQMWGAFWFKLWNRNPEGGSFAESMSIRSDFTGPEGHVIDHWWPANIGNQDADGNTIGQWTWFAQRHSDDVYDGVGDYFYGKIQARISSSWGYGLIRNLSDLPEGGDPCYPGEVFGSYLYYDIFSVYGSFEGPIPSGILPTTSSGGYFLFNVGESGCLMISEIPAAGNINDRLYVSQEGEIIIYNTDGRMLTSEDFGGTFRNTFPDSSPDAVSAVTNVQAPSLTSGFTSTFIAETKSADDVSEYQSSPTTTSGWLPATTLSGFLPKDAIFSKSSTRGILVGGSSATTKIYRHDPAVVPFDITAASDTGLPENLQSSVLDLEYGE